MTMNVEYITPIRDGTDTHIHTKHLAQLSLQSLWGTGLTFRRRLKSHFFQLTFNSYNTPLFLSNLYVNGALQIIIIIIIIVIIIITYLAVNDLIWRLILLFLSLLGQSF